MRSLALTACAKSETYKDDGIGLVNRDLARDTYPSTGITSTAVASRCWPEPSTTPPMGAASA
jgi:hypothetical protein